MRSYYPILSVVAALAALAVPAILIAWPFTSATPVVSETDGSGELRAELQRLGQSVAALQQRIDELERPLPIAPSPAPPPAGATVARPTSTELPANSATAVPLPATGLEPILVPGAVPPIADHVADSPGDSRLAAAPSRPVVESPATVRRPSEDRIVVPYPGTSPAEPAATSFSAPSAVATLTPLPQNSNQLLMTARPRHRDDEAAMIDPLEMEEDEPVMTPRGHRTSRKPPSRPGSRQQVQMPMTMSPEFAALGANTLDDWNEQPSFDLSISRPSSGLVRHWEEFVATTNVPGWPVVMVRSETEGDHWWVQQLVARQGNVIAAKVSFGNEDTIAGHQFDVVVLLLDSSAEAVRFRTARKFKQLPDGVQRSVVYRYVRR